LSDISPLSLLTQPPPDICLDELLTNQKSKLDMEIAHLYDENCRLSRFYRFLQERLRPSRSQFKALFREGPEREKRNKELSNQIALWEEELAAREREAILAANSTFLIDSEVALLQSQVTKMCEDIHSLADIIASTDAATKEAQDHIAFITSPDFEKSLKHRETQIEAKSRQIQSLAESNSALKAEIESIRSESRQAAEEVTELQDNLIKILQQNRRRRRDFAAMASQQARERSRLQTILSKCPPIQFADEDLIEPSWSEITKNLCFADTDIIESSLSEEEEMLSSVDSSTSLGVLIDSESTSIMDSDSASSDRPEVIRVGPLPRAAPIKSILSLFDRYGTTTHSVLPSDSGVFITVGLNSVDMARQSRFDLDGVLVGGCELVINGPALVPDVDEETSETEIEEGDSLP
jgi:hypothetical protein